MSANGSTPAGDARLRGGERLSILMRSFLIQSVWNTRGMQNVGFCFAMLPLLRTRRVSAADTSAYLKRHLSAFNTNPVFSCYALGAAAAAEASGDADRASEIKKTLAGPLGMAGDALMWWSLRPLAVLTASAFALAGRAWAPLVLLAVYNVPHLALRARGISAGADRGPAGAREVLGAGFRRVVASLRAMCALAAGLVLALSVRGGGNLDPRRFAAAAAFFVLAVVALRLRIPLTLIGLGGAAGGIALMLLGTV